MPPGKPGNSHSAAAIAGSDMLWNGAEVHKLNIQPVIPATAGGRDYLSLARCRRAGT
jgi:hypothetical protein